MCAALEKMLGDAVVSFGLEGQLEVKRSANPKAIVRTKGFANRKIRLAAIDLSVVGALEFAKKLRSKNNDALIMIIADKELSPMTYVNSAIRADALLIKPWDEDEAMSVILELIGLYVARNPKERGVRAFLIENSDEKRIVPYSEIYYFEARCKKIYVRTESYEYSMRGTLESIAKVLPDEFIRCHRSFIVNRNYLSGARFPENFVLMKNNLEVPLSRPYREKFREMFDDQNFK